MDTQPEVQLGVDDFDVRLRYTEDVDVVFTKKNSSLLTLQRGQWIRDNSNLHKQKLVLKPKPVASKMAVVKKLGQKNGEVGLLVE